MGGGGEGLPARVGISLGFVLQMRNRRNGFTPAGGYAAVRISAGELHEAFFVCESFLPSPSVREPKLAKLDEG